MLLFVSFFLCVLVLALVVKGGGWAAGLEEGVSDHGLCALAEQGCGKSLTTLFLNGVLLLSDCVLRAQARPDLKRMSVCAAFSQM